MTLIYQSTRDKTNQVTASQAILQGLATDGGLYVPTEIPNVKLDFEILKNASYQEVATLVLSAFLDDFTAEEIAHCVHHVSNVQVLDKNGVAGRVGYKVEGDKKVRYNKKSGEILD